MEEKKEKGYKEKQLVVETAATNTEAAAFAETTRVAKTADAEAPTSHPKDPA